MYYARNLMVRRDNILLLRSYFLFTTHIYLLVNLCEMREMKQKHFNDLSMDDYVSLPFDPVINQYEPNKSDYNQI